MELRTENLLLRQWLRRDFEFYASFFGNDSTAQHYGGSMTREQSWRHLASVIGHWELRGFGVWAVERSDDQQLIGCAGFWEPYGWPATELAFWFIHDAYAEDHAFDAVQAVLGRATAHPDISKIVSYIAPGNAPARELAEISGGTLVQTVDLYNFGAHCEYAFSELPSAKD